MKPLVGIDLHPLSLGALRFARWLAGSEELQCVHVLRDDYIRHAVAFGALSDIVSRAERAAQDTLRQAQIAGPAKVHVRQANEIDEGLRQAHGELGTELLVIGRNARKDGTSLIRLGSVARRVLRKARAPICVVPPDLDQVPSGPIVVATSADPGTPREMVEFARKLSEQTGRSLAVVHVVELADGYLQTHLSPKAIAAIHDDERAAGRRRLAEWGKACGLEPEALHLLEGEPIARIAEYAESCQAAVVVAAPKPRSALERLVTESISSSLAGRARCPVAVVPPT